MALDTDSTIPWSAPDADPLAGLRATATTPDEGITAEISGLDRVSIRLRPGVYERWTQADFEERLARLALRLWASRTRAFHALRAQDGGDPHTSGLGGSIAQDEAFRTGRAALVAIGRSPDDRVTVTLTGEHDFRVGLVGDALIALDEATFVRDCEAAATALIRDLVDQIRRLKFDVFG